MERPKIMNTGQLFVSPDLERLSESAAALFVKVAAEAINQRGRFVVALAGGSTPRRLYQLLADPAWRDRIPWHLCHFFWGDERLVPPDHPYSNFRLAQESLLAGLHLPPNQVHRVPVEEGDPAAVALAYEEELRRFFEPAITREVGASATNSPRPPAEASTPAIAGSPPSFDLILLGLGSDGHTASLFPGSRALEETRQWVVPAPPGRLPPPVQRVTLTLPVLKASRVTAFLVAGTDKSRVLRELLASDSDLPAARVQPWSGRLFWLSDRAAYSG